MFLDRRSLRAAALTFGLAAALALVVAAGASAATVALPLSAPALAASAPVVPAPANDERAGAQPIRSLPAAINGTTVGATIEAGESQSACGVQTASSV